MPPYCDDPAHHFLLAILRWFSFYELVGLMEDCRSKEKQRQLADMPVTQLSLIKPGSAFQRGRTETGRGLRSELPCSSTPGQELSDGPNASRLNVHDAPNGLSSCYPRCILPPALAVRMG